MVKYRAVSFKKDQIAALYFTMSDIVHQINQLLKFTGQNENSQRFQNFKLDKDPAHIIYLYLGSLVSMRVG